MSAFPHQPEISFDVLKRILPCYFKYASYKKFFHDVLRIKFLLNEVIYSVLVNGEAVSDENPQLNPLISKSVMYMLTDVSAPITLQSIASKFGISPCYYSELFHAEVGVPFKKWLIRVRIDRAKHLLEETNLPIISVALDSGFNTVSHFIRMFASYTGVTPAKYRKTLKAR